MLGARARPGCSPAGVLHGQTHPTEPRRHFPPASAETPVPGCCLLQRGEGSVPWVRTGWAACGCSVTPWDVQGGGHGATHLHEPTGVQPPSTPDSVPPSLATPAVPVSQRAHSWGRRGHVRCRDRLVASSPLAPTPGAGAVQLQAETCLSVITGEMRTSEDLHSSRATPGKQLSPSASS